MSAATGHHYVSVFDITLDPSETLIQKLKINISRPFQFLFGELIVALLSMYAAVVFVRISSGVTGSNTDLSGLQAVLYLMFSAYTFVFEVNRGFSPGFEGLTFMCVLSLRSVREGWLLTNLVHCKWPVAGNGHRY